VNEIKGEETKHNDKIDGIKVMANCFSKKNCWQNGAMVSWARIFLPS
jgi:hypothetical protein